MLLIWDSCIWIQNVNIVPIPLRNWPWFFSLHIQCFVLCINRFNYIRYTFYWPFCKQISDHTVQLQCMFNILIPIKIELRVLRTDFPSSSETHMILTTYTLTFIGFLLNFDVPHKYVIDSSFEPLKCLRCFSSTQMFSLRCIHDCYAIHICTKQIDLNGDQ